MGHVTGALFDVAAFGGVARHQHHQGQCMVNLDEKDLAVTADNRKNGGKDMGCNGGLMDNAFQYLQF